MGECENVTQGGQSAVLVDPSNPAQLANGIIELLTSPQRRRSLGQALQQRVMASHSVDAAWDLLEPLYQRIAGQTVKAA